MVASIQRPTLVNCNWPHDQMLIYDYFHCVVNITFFNCQCEGFKGIYILEEMEYNIHYYVFISV